MAWIPLDRSVFTHRKTMVLADALDISEVCAVGHLASFWTWAMDNAPNGEMDSTISDRIIAKAAGWESDASVFVSALLASGFLADTDGVKSIPNWMEYGGKLVIQKEKDAERKRAGRTQNVPIASAGCPPDVRRMSDVEKKRVEESRREEKRVEDEDDTTAPRAIPGTLVQHDAPLPVVVQDFIQAQSNPQEWEEAIRLEMFGRTLTGNVGSYQLATLKRWKRDGGPPKPEPRKATGERFTPSEQRFQREKAKITEQYEQLSAIEMGQSMALEDPFALPEPPPIANPHRVIVRDSAFERPARRIN